MQVLPLCVLLKRGMLLFAIRAVFLSWVSLKQFRIPLWRPRETSEFTPILLLLGQLTPSVLVLVPTVVMKCLKTGCLIHICLEYR